MTTKVDSTPKIIVHHEHHEVSSIEKAFTNAANFSKMLAHFEATPFLLGGIIMASGKGSNDIAQVSQGMGKMAIVASPLIYIAKVLALPVLAGGAIATAATGVAYGAEKLADKIHTHSEIKQERLTHTKHFAQRIFESIKGLDAERKAAARDNPGTLISHSLLTVVFLSRKLAGEQIEDGEQVIQKSHVEKMDIQAREYFTRTCKIKEHLQDLQLSPDDNLAWAFLNESIVHYYDKKDALQPSQLEAVGKIIKECDDLSKIIVEDEIFKQAWKEQFN